MLILRLCAFRVTRKRVHRSIIPTLSRCLQIDAIVAVSLMSQILPSDFASSLRPLFVAAATAAAASSPLKQQTQTIIIRFYLLKGYSNYGLCVALLLRHTHHFATPDDRNVQAINYSRQNSIILKYQHFEHMLQSFNYSKLCR